MEDAKGLIKTAKDALYQSPTQKKIQNKLIRIVSFFLFPTNVTARTTYFEEKESAKTTEKTVKYCPIFSGNRR